MITADYSEELAQEVAKTTIEEENFHLYNEEEIKSEICDYFIREFYS